MGLMCHRDLIFSQSKTGFFLLSLSGVTQRVEQARQAEAAWIFHLNLLCCDRFRRLCFQNFCKVQDK